MSNNPFSPDYVAKISMRDVARASKSSYQQTAVVNRKRAAGIEPNQVHLPGSRDDVPQRYAVSMPEMPKHDKNAARRRRRAEKGQT